MAMTRPVMTGISCVSGRTMPLLVCRLLSSLRTTTRLPMGSMTSNSEARFGGVGRVGIGDDYSRTPSPRYSGGEGGGEGSVAIVEQEAVAFFTTYIAPPLPNPLPG